MGGSTGRERKKNGKMVRRGNYLFIFYSGFRAKRFLPFLRAIEQDSNEKNFKDLFKN